MAVTNIHPIEATVDKAIDYILNPEKTDNGRLVSCIGCIASGKEAAKSFAAIREMGTMQGTVLAQHLVQSFEPGEVTPEEAHEIGLRLASDLLKGKYQFVLATHIDKDHIHNHLIFNNIDFENFRSFEYQENRGGKVFEKIQKMSDKLCKEYDLSVIKHPERGCGKSYYEWSMSNEGRSWKDKIKRTIDSAIMESSDFESFLGAVRKKDIEAEYNPENKYDLKFRMPDQKRFTRAKTLGWYYLTPQIKRRIENYHLIKTGQTITPQRSRLIDVSADKFQESKGLERWAIIQNMKEASRLMNLLTEKQISSQEELEEHSVQRYDEQINIVGELNAIQARIDDVSETIRLIQTYLKYKPVYDNFQKAAFRKRFQNENAGALEKYNDVKKRLADKFPDKKLPTLEHLHDERNALITQRSEKNDRYKSIAADLKELDYARTTIDAYIRSQQKSKDKGVNR